MHRVGSCLPCIVFKAKPNGRVVRTLNTLHPGAKYSVQKSAWCNQNVMLDWIEVIWKPFTIEMRGPTDSNIEEPLRVPVDDDAPEDLRIQMTKKNNS